MGYYLSCTGVTNPKKITFRESCGQPCATAEIECTGHTLTVGDTVTIDIGTDDNHQVVMTGGTAKKILQRRPGYDYVITVHDIMNRAVDYFIAPDDPSNPYRISNQSCEDVASVILGWCGITDFVYDASGITLGVSPGSSYNEIARVSVWNYIELLSSISGFMTYADSSGQVHFSNRQPYIVPGDVSVFSLATGLLREITSISLSQSSDSLINRVVVYGAPGIQSTSSASSPYLPTDFYKTAVISFPLIDTQLAADTTSAAVLAITNRLTETLKLSIIGDAAQVRCRDIVDVTESFTGLDGTLYFVYSASHSISESGYGIELELVK